MDAAKFPPLPGRAHGVAMIEFVIVAMPLLFTGLAAVELGRWYLVRQAVGYALFEAARAGSVSGAHPLAITQAFERALSPLYGAASPATRGASDSAASSPGRSDIAITPLQAQADVTQAFIRFERDHGQPRSRLEMLSPATASFDDFADAALQRRMGVARRVIDNTHQAEKDEADYARRYRAGTNPRSDQTIHDAKVLRLRLTYLQPPMLPGLRTLLANLPAQETGSDRYVQRARAQGLLVIAREISVPMQSDAVEYLDRGQTILP